MPIALNKIADLFLEYMKQEQEFLHPNHHNLSQSHMMNISHSIECFVRLTIQALAHEYLHMLTEQHHE